MKIVVVDDVNFFSGISLVHSFTNNCIDWIVKTQIVCHFSLSKLNFVGYFGHWEFLLIFALFGLDRHEVQIDEYI